MTDLLKPTSKKKNSLLLNGAPGKSRRRDLDFYPTPAEVTIALLEFLKLPKSVIWEPACGNGAMSKILEHYQHTVISTDIATESYGMPGNNFLKEGYHYACDCIITNPPFNLSHPFIKKALTIAQTVAILCKSQYWHSRSRAKLFRDNPPAWILPLTWRADYMNGEGGDRLPWKHFGRFG